MFPFRFSSIFRSRWMALFWAAGIVWTAVDVAGSPQAGAGNAESTGSGDAMTDEAQMKQVDKLLKDIGG